MKNNILVILGHPDTNSFCSSLAKVYVDSAKLSGSDVRELKLSELEFDPILWQGYKKIQELEPDLVKAQEFIQWSTHIVFVYPNWWGSMPALMKGFFDRVFLPGFAFKSRENYPFWDKLLSGRTAHLMVTMDTPPWYYRWVYHQPGHNQMKKAILGFSGIKVVEISEFAPIRASSQQQREKWITLAKELGSKAE